MISICFVSFFCRYQSSSTTVKFRLFVRQFKKGIFLVYDIPVRVRRSLPRFFSKISLVCVYKGYSPVRTVETYVDSLLTYSSLG